ncbi:Uu.00g039220.m01.CDS01 [Anthostomella pinea]|uniref:Uu.00g039220.m01.CDS01 n=1 Tax=Anthostomella pinea TaxID=933095 RepID=A0AAI8V9U3_9PEZI|nr:Uu.00g039220.m01.CDS01 [Anthostomella pinea]
MAASIDPNFPCALTVEVPFPTHRLASVALKALQVDKELSSLVTRSFAISAPSDGVTDTNAKGNILQAQYKATTNRMLRVAVNSFMESLALVMEVMEELDEDVLTLQDQVN